MILWMFFGFIESCLPNIVRISSHHHVNVLEDIFANVFWPADAYVILHHHKILDIGQEDNRDAHFFQNLLLVFQCVEIMPSSRCVAQCNMNVSSSHWVVPVKMNRGTTLHLLTHAEQKLAGRITSQEKNPTQNSGVVNSSAKVTNIFFEFDLIFQICLTLMTFGSTTFAQRNFNALNELEEASVAPIKSSKSLVPIKLDFAPLKKWSTSVDRWRSKSHHFRPKASSSNNSSLECLTMFYTVRILQQLWAIL